MQAWNVEQLVLLQNAKTTLLKTKAKFQDYLFEIEFSKPFD